MNGTAILTCAGALPGASVAFRLTGAAQKRAIATHHRTPQYLRRNPIFSRFARGASTMANKSSSKTARRTKTGAGKSRKPRAKAAVKQTSPFDAPHAGAFGDLSKMGKL